MINYFYSAVVNLVFVRVKGYLGIFTSHTIDLTYSMGSSNECKKSTMAEF